MKNKLDNEDEGDDEEHFDGDGNNSKPPPVPTDDPNKRLSMTQKVEQPKSLLEEAKEKEEKDKLNKDIQESNKNEAEEKAKNDREAKAEGIKIDIEKAKDNEASNNPSKILL
jgi:hypothetical protein